MHQAYNPCYCGDWFGPFRAVDAEFRRVGGWFAEFMNAQQTLRDEIATPKMVSLAANGKKVSLPSAAEPPSVLQTMKKQENSGCETIEKLCQFLRCSQVVKNVLYQAVLLTMA